MSTRRLHAPPAPQPGRLARLVLACSSCASAMIMVTALVGLAVTPGAPPASCRWRCWRWRCWGLGGAGPSTSTYEAESDR